MPNSLSIRRVFTCEFIAIPYSNDTHISILRFLGCQFYDIKINYNRDALLRKSYYHLLIEHNENELQYNIVEIIKNDINREIF